MTADERQPDNGSATDSPDEYASASLGERPNRGRAPVRPHHLAPELLAGRGSRHRRQCRRGDGNGFGGTGRRCGNGGAVPWDPPVDHSVPALAGGPVRLLRRRRLRPLRPDRAAAHRHRSGPYPGGRRSPALCRTGRTDLGQRHPRTGSPPSPALAGHRSGVVAVRRPVRIRRSQAGRSQADGQLPEDNLDPAQCQGDISVQLFAADADTVIHALRDITKYTRGGMQPRWRIDGFVSPPRPSGTRATCSASRTASRTRTSDSAAAMDELVWVRRGAPEPAWTYGGTYQVVRIIRMLVEFWDRVSLNEQEIMIGRRRDSGAPLDGNGESDTPTTPTTRGRDHPAHRAHPAGQPAHAGKRTPAASCAAATTTTAASTSTAISTRA